MGTCASYCLKVMEKEIEIHKDYIKSPEKKRKIKKDIKENKDKNNINYIDLENVKSIETESENILRTDDENKEI